MEYKAIGTRDRPPLGQWAALSVQHVFAMFGATILVPILITAALAPKAGLDPSTALFTAGTGTLIFIICTGAKVPIFLGSSFAFIPALISIGTSHGIAYALGGAVVAGLFYCLIGIVISFCGTRWLDKVLPPVVIGSVIITIGMSLAPIAVNMSSTATFDGSGEYSLAYLSIAAVALGVTAVANIYFKGFLSAIPVLIGLLAGYFFTLIMGNFFPAFKLIDFQVVKEAPWFGLPSFQLPQFSLVPVITFVIVALAPICEHLGNMLVASKIVGQDFYKNPGLHRTLASDGLATAWAAIWGGPPNTTYSENIGVMAMTRVYSVWVIGGAAVIAVFLSMFRKFGALIQTIPTPVLGGISILLFGIIASSGIRTLVENGIDYREKRNLTISSVILIIGIGGGKLAFFVTVGSKAVAGVTEMVEFQLAGVALATLMGILLNLIFPNPNSKKPKTNSNGQGTIQGGNP